MRPAFARMSPNVGSQTSVAKRSDVGVSDQLCADRFLQLGPGKDILVPRRSIDGVCHQSKPLPTSFRHGPRRAFCAGRAPLLRVVPSGAAGCRFQRRRVTCVTPPQVGNLQFRAAVELTAARKRWSLNSALLLPTPFVPERIGVSPPRQDCIHK